MDKICNCCQGIEPLTPMDVTNRPGLQALLYRVGTHATFLETMLARLSSSDYPALAGLTTRERSDPAIALLDAWATVADVLTFYQERIANEGYLRTATWRRSILELARLVGYTLRPGVAASVYLAYTVDENAEGEVTIPQGARVQSVPGPGELPQTFETSEELKARWEWNTLKPRLFQPQYLTLDSIKPETAIWVKPVSPALAANDPLLLEFDNEEKQLFRVLEVLPSAETTAQNSIGNQADSSISIRIQAWASEPGTEPPGDGLIAQLLDYLRKRFLPKQWGIAANTPLVRRQVALFDSMAEEIINQGWGLDQPGQILGRLRPVARQLHGERHRLDNRLTGLWVWIDALLRELQIVADFFQLLQVVQQMGQVAHGKDKARLIKLVRQAERQLTALRQDLRKSPRLARLLHGELESVRNAILKVKQQLIDSQGEALTSVASRYAFTKLVQTLSEPPAVPPASPQRLERSATRLFSMQGDMVPRVLVKMIPRLEQAYAAWGKTSIPPVSPQDDVQVLKSMAVLRVKAGLFGNNISGLPVYKKDGELLKVASYDPVQINNTWPGIDGQSDEPLATIYLDREYDQIKLDSWVAIERPSVADIGADVGRPQITIHQVTDVQTVTVSASGAATSVTQLTLNPPWLDGLTTEEIKNLLAKEPMIRTTRVYVQGEPVVLAEQPLPGHVSGNTVELAELYSDLEPGRWLIVSGERAGLDSTSGVKGSELAMLANVTQDVKKVDETMDLPGDKPHTFIQLEGEGLAYSYKRDTVKIYTNVVKATHGETHSEVLGGGDGSKAMQSFTLKQAPVTHVAAPVPSGVESTLQVRVNDVQWHEADTLAGLGATDRNFITKTDDENKTTVIFGEGLEGARLPTGIENVKAVYRSGIGKGGNVKAEQISLLMTRPLGVKEVVNPLAASGGADRESRDLARVNAPLAVRALDRLVSTQDYADFARTYAGIGKASAAQLSDGRRQLVYLTIAGVDDIPIEEHSDLYRNLVQALRRYGDPHQPFQVKMRELLLLIVEAGVRLLPDYQWESVEPKIRRVLLDALSFERRELGQDVFYSEVVSVIQAVRGVAYVDLDVLDAASQEDVLAFLGQEQVTNLIDFLAEQRRARNEAQEEQPRKRIPVHLAHPDTERTDGIAPAQLVFLSPEVPDTLILKEIPA